MTAAQWRERMESKNPVWPFEWTIFYTNGRRFHRVCNNRVRTTAMAPLFMVGGLVIRGGPCSSQMIQALHGRNPDRIVAVSHVELPFGDPQRSHGVVTGWSFGFQYDSRFVGVKISADGSMLWTR